MPKPSYIVVTADGERLDLYEPRQADRFLTIWTSYATARAAGNGQEFILAQRIVSAAIEKQKRKR